MKRFLKNSFVPTFPCPTHFWRAFKLGHKCEKGGARSATWLGRKSEASPSEQSLCSDFFRPTHGPAHRLLWATRSNLAGRLGKAYFRFFCIWLWINEKEKKVRVKWKYQLSPSPWFHRPAEKCSFSCRYLAVDKIRSDRKWKWKENMFSHQVQKSTGLLWNAYSAIV